MLYFRGTPGALAVVQAWRVAMMKVRTVEFINDQTLFNNVIHSAGLRQLRGGKAELERAWLPALRRDGRFAAGAFDAWFGNGGGGLWLGH